MKKINYFLLVTFLFFQACSDNYGAERVWIKNDQEKFYLKWKFEKENLITLNTEVHYVPRKKDLPNVIPTKPEKIERVTIIDYWKNCKYFDDKNWSCETVSPNDEWIKMENGNLTWYYKGELRKYSKVSDII